MDFFTNLFSTDGFPARWYCGTWSSAHGWLHILSDIGIFGAYTAIPCVLAYFILRRRDIPFPNIMWLFVAFIFACGFGHLIEAVIFWQPVYRLSGVVKFATAVVSWATVLALVQIVPQVLHFPGLAKLNHELRKEVDERTRVEAALRESEVKLANLLASERDARSDAERANRIKDEFLSTVSHELRTPLHAILGYAQLLQRGEVSANEQEGLAVIERNAKAQAKIIEDLLDMSRIISGKVRLDTKSVDMAAVIESAIATVQPAADARNVRLQCVLDPKAGPVLGDSGRLQQVVWNLLTNAVKFTPKGGRVQVSLKRINSHIEIHISDTGQGITADFLPFVFDRFRQADSSTTRVHTGVGLGLSIVKHLVELHGGTIQAKSPGMHQGSTFIVTLPVQIVHDEALATPEAATETRHSDRTGPNLAGVKVLVVDDEADSREFVKRLLAEHAVEVATAGSAEEALQAVRKQLPDVLVSDIGMPVQDGYELMRMIRALPEAEGGRLPAAALTALARSEDRTRAMLAGFQAYVTKPVDGDELVAAVATLAGRTGR